MVVMVAESMGNGITFFFPLPILRWRREDGNVGLLFSPPEAKRGEKGASDHKQNPNNTWKLLLGVALDSACVPYKYEQFPDTTSLNHMPWLLESST